MNYVQIQATLLKEWKNFKNIFEKSFKSHFLLQFLKKTTPFHYTENVMRQTISIEDLMATVACGTVKHIE